MSQFRVDEIGHAKIISVNLRVLLQIALSFSREAFVCNYCGSDARLRVSSFVQLQENLLFLRRSFDVEEKDVI